MNTAKIATERAVYWMKYGETKDARLAEAEELLRQAMLRRTCYCESASCHCGAYRHSADFGKAAAAFLARTEPAK